MPFPVFPKKTVLVKPETVLQLPSNIGGKTFTVSIHIKPGAPAGTTYHWILVGGGSGGRFAEGNAGGGGVVNEGDTVAVNGTISATIGAGNFPGVAGGQTVLDVNTANGGTNPGPINAGNSGAGLGGAAASTGGGGFTAQGGGGGGGNAPQNGGAATVAGQFVVAGAGGAGKTTSRGFVLGGGGGGGSDNSGTGTSAPGLGGLGGGGNGGHSGPGANGVDGTGGGGGGGGNLSGVSRGGNGGIWIFYDPTLLDISFT